MTLRQRRLIWNWIAGCALLVLATTVHWIGLLAPLVFVMERERFEELGEN
jgi:hypothetical protein